MKHYVFLKQNEDKYDKEIIKSRNKEQVNNYTFKTLRYDGDNPDNITISDEDEDFLDVSEYLTKKEYFANLRDKIRGIRESFDTPSKKLIDFIAATALDYTPGSTKTRVIFRELKRRFQNDSATKNIVDDILIVAETETLMGVTRTVQQWYDNFMSLADNMQPASEKLSKLKAENLSLKSKVQNLEIQLRDAKELDEARIAEIDKWHGLYEHAMAEISMWQHNYEEAKGEITKKAEDNKHEVAVLKLENANLRENIVRLQTRLESENAIVATAKSYLGDKSLAPEIILRRHPDDEAYKKKEKVLEDKIKNLQEKLGNESVPLSVLAEGLKDYAEETDIRDVHELFNHLNNLLINVPAWTKNVPELKKFFKKARKEREVRNVTMTGEHATYNEYSDKEEKE